MIRADNRRIDGWRVVREYLKSGDSYGGEPRLTIYSDCKNLVRCLPMLMFDSRTREDAADTPHEITHAPEALRYALMSRQPQPVPKKQQPLTSSAYTFDIPSRSEEGNYDDFLAY